MSEYIRVSAGSNPAPHAPLLPDDTMGWRGRSLPSLPTLMLPGSNSDCFDLAGVLSLCGMGYVDCMGCGIGYPVSYGGR